MTLGFKNLGHLLNRRWVSRDPDHELANKLHVSPWFEPDPADPSLPCNPGGGGGELSPKPETDSLVPAPAESRTREDTPSMESDANDILNDVITITSCN